MRGIADHEILSDLLGDERTDRSTSEIVEYIAAAVTPKREAHQCIGCDGPDHGGRSHRLSDCPALPSSLNGAVSRFTTPGNASSARIVISGGTVLGSRNVANLLRRTRPWASA